MSEPDLRPAQGPLPGVLAPRIRKTLVMPAAPLPHPGELVVYWKPVAWAALLTVAGVVTLAVATRPADGATEQELAAVPNAPLTLAPSLMPTVEEPTPSLALAPLPRAVCKSGPAADVLGAAAKPGRMPLAAPSPMAVAPVLAKPEVAKVEAPPAPEPPGCHGTAIRFERNLEEGMLRADEERKLLFVLHVSGDFDDAGFT